MNRLTLSALVALGLVAAFLLGRSLGTPAGVEVLSPAEFEIQMNEALANPDSFDRNVETIALLQQLDAENLSAGVRALEAQLDTLPESTVRLFVGVWMRIDRQGAFDHILNWPKTKMKHGMKQIIFTWALDEPLEARDLIQIIPAEMVREAVISSLVGGWAKGGKPGVDEYLLILGSGPLQTKLTAVVATWIVRREGAEAALEWAESQPGEERDGFRKTAMERVLNQVVPVDPELAVRWANKHADKAYARTLPREIAKRWFPMDPEATLAWLGTIEDPERQARLSSIGFRRWSQLDDRAARDWITTSELTPSHDIPLALFATNLAKREPETALIWAARVHADILRHETQKAILGTWTARSPERAEAWIKKNPLPVSVVEAASQEPNPR